jgi:hypothetical protein
LKADTVDFMKRILVFAALTAFAALAFGQQYKWIDKDGRVQYGDAPPPGVSATRLPGSGAAPAAPAAEPQSKGPLTPAEQEAAFRKRQLEAGKERDKQAQADQLARDRQENCARAQAALRSYESGTRVARTDTKGERYFLDEAQVAQETAKARQAAQESCK